MRTNMDVPIAFNLSRRGFVAALGLGGLVIATGTASALEVPTKAAGFGAMLGIAADGSVSIICPSSEMGQGTQEALARMIAEELDCGWDKVMVRQPWADPAFINPAAHHQVTSNSMTVMGYFIPLRTLGASARAMLVQVAAVRLGVGLETLTTADGMVRHLASGRTLGYGVLADEAAKLPVPAKVSLKDAKDFRLIGKSSPRKDLVAKVTGAAEFGMDVHEDGILSAALVLAPHPADTFTVAGAAAAKAMPGVVAVTPVTGGVAIVAERFWLAKVAAEKVTLTITHSPIAGLSDAVIAERLEAGFTTAPAAPFPNLDLSSYPPKSNHSDPAEVAAALAAAPSRIETRYEVPYLAHAAMEPLCCAARFRDGELLVRGPFQDPETSRSVAAAAAGLPLDKVQLEVTFIGGGFGRKWSSDFVGPAVQAALAAPGHMVKMIWTREQDFAVDQYRPAFVAKSTAGIGKQGEILAMHSRIAGQSVLKYQHRTGPAALKGAGDGIAAGLLIYGAYDFPQKLIEYHEVDIGLPVGFWRSVNMSQNAFFAESMIDEIARATHQDGYKMRRKLLTAQPRITAVLDRAAAMIGWDKPKAKGIGRGIAISYAPANFCAQAVEVQVKAKKLTIRSIVCAFDCGLMVDPVSVEAQISGGIVFGLQAALWGEMGFSQGKTTTSNFGDYRMPLLADIPPIEVALISGSDRPGNAGEAGTPAIAPALANAIADAGGPRIRRLPIVRTLDI